MSLSVLYLYKCCIILFSKLNWPCYVFFNVKMKNLAFDTSKVITKGMVFYEGLTWYLVDLAFE